jgi:hypothetical protein
MKSVLLTNLCRRDMFRAIAGVAIVASATIPVETAATEPTGSKNKRRARYQANAPEVQNFYRVARYPVR